MNRNDVKVMFVPSEIMDGYKIDRLNKFKLINVTDAKVICDLNEKMSKAPYDALMGISPELIIDYRTIREICLTNKSIDLKQDNFVLPTSLQNYGSNVIDSQYPIFYYKVKVIENILIIIMYDTKQNYVDPNETLDADDSELEEFKFETVIEAFNQLIHDIDNRLDTSTQVMRELFVFYATLCEKNLNLHYRRTKPLI